MDLTTFAVDHGFVDAKLRGYRSTFLKNEHYSQLKNFNTLEEVYQYLQTETDYGEYIDLNNVSINALR
jgi:vacuolar-type H+-ATPase subunit C/Vma6